MDVDIFVVLDSGTAEFVLFEQDEIRKYAGQRADWCADDQVQVAIANAGVAIFIPVGVDGAFAFRLTTGALTLDEQEHLFVAEKRCWLEVHDHELRFGGLETLPTGEGGETLYIYEDEYATLPFEPGRYHVEIYRLEYLRIDDEEEKNLRARADYVLRFTLFGPGEIPAQLTAISDIGLATRRS